MAVTGGCSGMVAQVAPPGVQSLTPAPGTAQNQVAGVNAAPAPVGPGPGAAFVNDGSLNRIPRAQQTDAQLIEGAFADLRNSPRAKAVLAAMVAGGVNIELRNDHEFAAMGMSKAHGFFRTDENTMYLRREALIDPTRRSEAVLTLLHEAVHAVDTRAGLHEKYLRAHEARIEAAGGANSPAGRELFEHAEFRSRIRLEARGHLMAGLVAHELGLPANVNEGAAVVARYGPSKDAYLALWRMLVESPSYNPERREAAPMV